MKGKHKKKKNIKWLYTLGICAFACITIYSSYQIIIWIKSDYNIKKAEEGLFSEVVTIENENQNAEGLDENKKKIDFDRLKNINKDVIGWISIDNTYINYPIMQGETDEYYLRKDIYKEYSISGSIFVDTSTKSNFTDNNTVIYGHNMKNDRMFSDLTKIYNGDLGKEILIEIYTEKSLNRYKVFASYIDTPKASIIQKNFTASDKKKYIENAVKKSNVKFETEINDKNEILTLATCNTTGKKRIIVNAIKIN